MSEDLRRKLTSRKFWAALAVFVAGMIKAFGGAESVAAEVTALIMAGAAVVAYIIGEGLIDAAGAKDDGVVILPPVAAGDKKPPDVDEDDGK